MAPGFPSLTPSTFLIPTASQCFKTAWHHLLQEGFCLSLSYRYSLDFQIAISIVMCVIDYVTLPTYLLPSQRCSPCDPSLVPSAIRHGQWLPQIQEMGEGMTQHFCAEALRDSMWCCHEANMSQKVLFPLLVSRNVGSMEQECRWLTENTLKATEDSRLYYQSVVYCKMIYNRFNILS